MELMQPTTPMKRFAVLHTNAEQEAREMLKQFAPDIQTVPLVVNVTTAIGADVGPQGLGFAALYQEETKQ